MKPRLKPVQDQVIVITGASSGIGLTTARAAAKEGARLVLAARSDQALEQLVNEINSSGGQAVHVAADVGSEADVRKIAQAAVDRFGGFDTWVNNAGISVYGRVDEISLDDARRVFETNFWGVVHGSRIAAEYLRRTGGALINVGSVVSDRAIPLQGIYSASKHAVKGFTDALRMELEEQNAPVVVTLIKPGSINTPFPRHAKNYMEAEATLPPPVYAPDVVADAILHCAEHAMRELVVGGGGKMIAAAGAMPGLADKYMEKTLFDQQKKDRPNPGRDRNALYAASEDLSERGDYEGHTMESSLYTKAATHPVLATAAIVGAGLAAAALVVAAGRREEDRTWTGRAARQGRNLRDWASEKAADWW